MSGLIFHLIPHTHWDREWYLPRAAFQARLVPALDDVLERLTADPGYRSFLLDGQTVLVADYLRARPGARPVPLARPRGPGRAVMAPPAPGLRARGCAARGCRRPGRGVDGCPDGARGARRREARRRAHRRRPSCRSPRRVPPARAAG